LDKLTVKGMSVEFASTTQLEGEESGVWRALHGEKRLISNSDISSTWPNMVNLQWFIPAETRKT